MTMLPANTANGGFISDYFYNPTHNSIVATLYQDFVSELVLPNKASTDISDYKWTMLMRSGTNSANIFKAPLVSATLPIVTPFSAPSI